MPNTDRRQIAEIFARAGIRQGMVVRSAAILPSKNSPDATRALPQDGDDGAFFWTLTTEQPSVVFDWERYDFVDEILLSDGIVIPDSGQIPLLNAHSRYSVEDQLGSVRGFTLGQSGAFRSLDASVYFSEADDISRSARAKVLEGHLTDGSVGYRVEKSIYIPEGEEAYVQGKVYKGPVKVSYRAKIMEFSVTPIGADALAKVRVLCQGQNWQPLKGR